MKMRSKLQNASSSSSLVRVQLVGAVKSIGHVAIIICTLFNFNPSSDNTIHNVASAFTHQGSVMNHNIRMNHNYKIRTATESMNKFHNHDSLFNVKRQPLKQRMDSNVLQMASTNHDYKTLQQSLQSLALTALIFVGTTMFQPQFSAGEEQMNTSNSGGTDTTTTTTTATKPVLNNRSRYWSSINSNDKEQIIAANEKLMDYAVGTINIMYYDNSGGAYFSTKDFYDRWKILRVYSKEGVEGVKDSIRYSDISKVSPLSEEVIGSSTTTSMKGDDTIENVVVEKFKPQLFLVQGDSVKVQMDHWNRGGVDKNDNNSIIPPHAFDSREDIISSLKWLVGTLNDPYSKYLTRDELQQELKRRDDGFLGLGVIVEGPRKGGTTTSSNMVPPRPTNAAFVSVSNPTIGESNTNNNNVNKLLTLSKVSDLPIVTAIAPNSPAERAGIVVGDRIASVGGDEFIGLKLDDVMKKMDVYTGADNYFGNPVLTIAKPVYRTLNLDFDDSTTTGKDNYRDGMMRKGEVMGYKLSRVRMTTISLQAEAKTEVTTKEGSTTLVSELIPSASAASTTNTNTNMKTVSGGDSIVQWELLTPNDSIFRKYTSTLEEGNVGIRSTDRVGYIRLTRFSRLSTAGYINAVEELEKAGAQSYIIDVRNNYGGVIQESMLTASTLLRDPHTVLCYTLNSRGGFTPHDAEEYVVDTRYPGYLLSSEPKEVTMDQVKLESPNFVSGEGWIPPSSYASIREQRMKREISRTSTNPFGENFKKTEKPVDGMKQLQAQKKVVILMNEGTASAAEVFVSSLHDNGRTVATIGTKTYGKGLIQHTFPLQDGGGLRLTVAEYLTPALQHVTKVGSAQYDRMTGEYVGGGVKPDIFCPSTQGIPSKVGADICMGMALDALEDADAREMKLIALSDNKKDDNNSIVVRRGGTGGGGGRRRTLTQGIVAMDF